MYAQNHRSKLLLLAVHFGLVWWMGEITWFFFMHSKDHLWRSGFSIWMGIIWLQTFWSRHVLAHIHTDAQLVRLKLISSMIPKEHPRVKDTCWLMKTNTRTQLACSHANKLLELFLEKLSLMRACAQAWERESRGQAKFYLTVCTDSELSVFYSRYMPKANQIWYWHLIPKPVLSFYFH